MRWLVCDVSVQFAFMINLTAFQTDLEKLREHWIPSVAIVPSSFSHMLCHEVTAAMVLNRASKWYLTTFLVGRWVAGSQEYHFNSRSTQSTI